MGYTKSGPRGNRILYKREDLQHLVNEFLSLEVPTCNSLTWKLDEKVWKRMMKRATRFEQHITKSSLTETSKINIVVEICAERVASATRDEDRTKWKKLRGAAKELEKWDEIEGFPQLKTTDYIAVSQCLRICIALNQDVLHAIAILWITSSSFQECVKTLLEHWTSKESGDIFAVKADIGNSTLTWLLEVVTEPEESDALGGTGSPSAEPSTQHETANPSSSETQEDPMEIKEIALIFNLSESDVTAPANKNNLREAKTLLRRLKAKAKRTTIQNGANLQFEIDILPSPSPNTTSPSTFQMTSAEVFLIVMWAATRCALWEEAPDSKPLLDFVRKLSDVVHVA